MGFLDELLPEVEREVRLPGYLDGLPEATPPARPGVRRAIFERIPGRAGIVELKRRAPGSTPPELPMRPVAEFASLAESAGACALSCVATRPRFDGAPRLVRELVLASTLPVLFKDVVVEPVQVEAARRSGASAILLIARLETERRISHPLKELAREAHESGLEVWLELHRPEEVAVASAFPADVYGVNVRDLDSLKLEWEVARETIHAAQRLRPLIGMSGVRGPTEAEWFRGLGTDGVLLGSALARSADPGALLLSLGLSARRRSR